MKKIDNYTWSLVLLIVALVAIAVGFKSGKKEAVYGGLALWVVSAGFVAYTYGRSSGQVVENNYENNTKVLPEKWKEDCYFINKGEKATNLDGLNTFIKTNQVYKVSNGVKVQIDKDGNIKPTTIIGKLANSKGGWRSDLNQEKNKEHWKCLYKKADYLENI